MEPPLPFVEPDAGPRCRPPVRRGGRVSASVLRGGVRGRRLVSGQQPPETARQCWLGELWGLRPAVAAGTACEEAVRQQRFIEEHAAGRGAGGAGLGPQAWLVASSFQLYWSQSPSALLPV